MRRSPGSRTDVQTKETIIDAACKDSEEATLFEADPLDTRRGAAEPPLDPSGEVRATADAAAVSHLFEQARIAFAVNLLLVALLAATLHGHIGAVWLYGWCGALIAINLGRVVQARAYARDPSPEPGTWVRRYLLTMAASSALWGLAAPLFLPGLPPLPSSALVVAIAGIAAGALPLHAAVLPVYLSHIGLTLVPAVATFLAMGQFTYLMLAFMSLLFGGSLIIAGRGYHQNLYSANQFAARLREMNRELERRASHDALTGLWNRQCFEEYLDAELDRVSRYASLCSLIMLDVDRFKSINDSYGHAIGDHVLAELGELLGREIRRPDEVARWGGEEFMVLLPQTSAESALAVAERLRRRVAKAEVDGPGHITISLGVTSSSAPEERSELLKRLDDALYLAKQSGRNCVRIVAEPERLQSARPLHRRG